MCVFVCLCILMHDLSFLHFRTPSLLLCVCVSECVCVCLLYASSLFLVFARLLVSSPTFFHFFLVASMFFLADPRSGAIFSNAHARFLTKSKKREQACTSCTM